MAYILRDLTARLKKIETAIGDKPVYVNFTDVRGQTKERYPLSSLQYALQSQISYMWFELQADRDTMNPVPMVDFTIPDCEIIPIVDQLIDAGKFAEGVTRKVIGHCQAGLFLLARGWMKTGENKHYLIHGHTVTDFDEDTLLLWMGITSSIRLAIEDEIRAEIGGGVVI